jgi:hypothetical protein
MGRPDAADLRANTHLAILVEHVLDVFDKVKTADSSRKRKKEISQMGTLMKGSVDYIIMENRQNDLLALLEEKFGTVPEEIRERITNVEDAERLRWALRSVLRLKSIDDFQV